MPIPLPRVFVLGLDRSSEIQEERGTTRGYNYVLGRLNTHGIWYAFPLMVLLKTPLALFGLMALAAWRRRRTPDEPPSDGVILLLPFCVVLAFFSLLAEPQLGIRYLLPGLPLLSLYASASVAGLLSSANAPDRGRAGLVVRRFVALLHAAPDVLLQRADRPAASTPGAFSPTRTSTGRTAPATSSATGRRIPIGPSSSRPGSRRAASSWWRRTISSASAIPERYRWLRENFAPIEHVGYSYLLFRVPEERLREVLARPPVRPGAGPEP